MTIEGYRQKMDLDPCLRCGCWDPDLGCTMLSVDKVYVCPLKTGEEDHHGD